MATRHGTVIHDLGEKFGKRAPYSKKPIEGNTCTYCGIELTKYTKTRDHPINIIENKRIRQLSNFSSFCVPCCRSCNCRKGKKDFKLFNSQIISEDEIVLFYYDQVLLNDSLEEIEKSIKKADTIVKTIPIFEDEHDYMFTRHILTDDFVMIYDDDILKLEKLRMRISKLLINESP
jgi:hypothetical protein